MLVLPGEWKLKEKVKSCLFFSPGAGNQSTARKYEACLRGEAEMRDREQPAGGYLKP